MFVQLSSSVLSISTYIVATNFCLELIEPSARKVFIFWTLVEREGEGVSEGRRREHGSNLARIKTASELQKTVDPQPL